MEGEGGDLGISFSCKPSLCLQRGEDCNHQLVATVKWLSDQSNPEIVWRPFPTDITTCEVINLEVFGRALFPPSSPPPPSVYLTLHHIVACDKISHAFPGILKVTNNTENGQLHHSLYHTTLTTHLHAHTCLLQRVNNEYT